MCLYFKEPDIECIVLNELKSRQPYLQHYEYYLHMEELPRKMGPYLVKKKIPTIYYF